MARLYASRGANGRRRAGSLSDCACRIRHATTRDIALGRQVQDGELLERLIEVTLEDLGDFFSFEVKRTPLPPGGAHRFRVAASLAGRLLGTFLLDVGEGDGPTFSQPEALTTPDLLAFAGCGQREMKRLSTWRGGRLIANGPPG